MPSDYLKILSGPLAGAANISSESYEKDFSELGSLMQKGAFGPLVDKANKILRDGIYDIRIIVYYFYGIYATTGQARLGAIFECLNKLLTEDKDDLKPDADRNLHICKSVTWLFNQVNRKIVHEKQHLKDKDEAEFLLPKDTIVGTLGSLESLIKTLFPIFNDSDFIFPTSFSMVCDWFKELNNVIDMKSEELYAYNDEKAVINTDEQAKPSSQQKKENQPKSNNAMNPATGDGSAAMKQLINKMRIFKNLVEDRKMKQAAIVMDDILATLENFDPRVFLPELFKGFMAIQAANIEELSQFAMEKGSPEWMSLESCYTVDIDGFENLNL
ncbi:MAG: hypothetical protein GY839_11345 [candidate division Zixibacteria bacterium]|nr:hypothetical protein [candidate division Zixibacteria bacterium]